MIEDILDSKAKIKIIKVFCLFPERNFQMIEIAKHSKLSNSRTSECLRDLARIGLLESRKIGKGCEYKLNQSTYYSKMLLRFFKEEENLLTNIIRDYIKDIKNLKRVESVVIFGSALTGLKIGSDIDFFVVGKEMIEKESISMIETELINKYGFHISTTFMTEEELREKAKKGEEFVINVMANGKVIYGKNLEDIVWSGK